MNEEDDKFKTWLALNHPHVKLLLDEEIGIDGVNFFGGTMWTDFNGTHRLTRGIPGSSWRGRH